MRLKIYMAILTVAGLVFSSRNQVLAQEKIQEDALRQIESLVQDKKNGIPAQEKMHSDFIYAARMEKRFPTTPLVKTLDVGFTKM